MLTRCPQCETLYPLTTTQLKAAEGRVRCSRCSTVFYGLEHLYKDETTGTADSGPPELQNSIKTSDNTLAGAAAGFYSETFDELPSALLQHRQKQGSSFFWWLLAVILILGALAQGLWLQRELLLSYPQVSQLLEPLCKALDCNLPQRRAIDKIQILSREMTSHPDKKDALLFLLVMVNQAPFAQPYPHLQLELFAKNQESAGSRTLAPSEYLDAVPDEGLMQPDNTVYLRLELVDPGPAITGFEIRFL